MVLIEVFIKARSRRSFQSGDEQDAVFCSVAGSYRTGWRYLFYQAVRMPPLWNDLLHLNAGNYPLGVLPFGIGILIATTMNPYHLVLASFFVGTIPASFLPFILSLWHSAIGPLTLEVL